MVGTKAANGDAAFRDTPQQRAVLRKSVIARKVRALFPPGTRVRAYEGDETAPVGTVRRHVPGGNAQGGTLVVAWPNGTTGRHSAGSLTIVDAPETENEEPCG